MKMNRGSLEYKLAERIVHLEDALDTANCLLNKDGKLGIIPNHGVDFREGRKFHKRVNKILNEGN